MIQSAPHHPSNMLKAVMLKLEMCTDASRTGSLVFIDDVTAEVGR